LLVLNDKMNKKANTRGEVSTNQIYGHENVIIIRNGVKKSWEGSNIIKEREGPSRV